MKLPWRAALAVAAILEAEPALADNPIPELGGLWSALLHPVMVPAHALALFGLGLFAGQQALRERVALVAIFAAAFAAGIGAIVAAFAVTDATTVILAAGGGAGILVAVARPTPRLVGAGLATIAGAALALDSVPQTISMRDTLIELSATAISATVILAIVAKLTTAAEQPWKRIGLRVLGSWAAASAIFALALRFAP